MKKCGDIRCVFYNTCEPNNCRTCADVTMCDDYVEIKPDTCPDCNGSGEGQHDGTKCQNPVCKGGVLVNLTD